MLAPGPDGRYGLGIVELSPASACRLHGHAGSLPGWSSLAAADPASGVTVVVLLRGAEGEAAPGGAMLLLNTLRDQDVLDCG